jgi:acyl carrier protein
MALALAATLNDIAEMLRAVLGPEGADMPIAMETAFFGDLAMASIDLVGVGGRLHARYGTAVNFARFIAGLRPEEVRDLRVGRLVEFVAASLAAEAMAQQ